MQKKNIKERLRDKFDEVVRNLCSPALWLLLSVAIVVIGLSLSYYIEDFSWICRTDITQAHGMIFDIAVIGILIFWLNQNGEIRQRIRTYKDEIDDFRLWESEEAAFRRWEY